MGWQDASLLILRVVQSCVARERCFGVAKPHVVSFGKWTTIKWCVGPAEAQCLDLKVRALYVDGRVRESTLSASHEITERLFVVRRAFRVNDALPGDKSVPGWVWQR
jgi:hypothetical protein